MIPTSGKSTFSGATIPQSRKVDAVAAELLRTADAVRAMGKKVVLFSPTAASANDTGQCLLKAAAFAKPYSVCDFAGGTSLANRAAFIVMDRVAGKLPVIRIDHMTCSRSKCMASEDGALLYRDAGHLSVEGSQYLGRRFDWANLVRRVAR